jgi:hypothetical protein
MMAGVTLAQAQAKLDALQTTYNTLISIDSSYSISTPVGSRAVSKRTLSELREEITYWDAQVKKLTRGGIGIRGVTPIG